MQQTYLAGIDIGTSGAKAMIFDLSGGSLASAYREYGSTYPRPNWVEQDADLLIAGPVGLPRGLPFIRFTEQSGWTSKLPDVVRFVGDRAVAWVDDQLDPDAHAWAESREAPTLLVETDHRVGLELEHISMLRAFAASVRASATPR